MFSPGFGLLVEQNVKLFGQNIGQSNNLSNILLPLFNLTNGCLIFKQLSFKVNHMLIYCLPDWTIHILMDKITLQFKTQNTCWTSCQADGTSNL